MADFVKGFFGGATPSPASPGDSDFAEFAAKPSPEAAASPVLSQIPAVQTFGPNVPFSDRPYTKWYRVNERVSIQDFYTELFILPVLVLLAAFHFWGSRKNRSKAKAWISDHAPTLANEFAVVGFGGGRRLPSAEDVVSVGLTKASGNDVLLEPELLLKEKSKDNFISYATGRQNIAFVDIKITLLKRYNPLGVIAESAFAMFMDSFAAPTEKVQITAYPFDGKEADVVPKTPGTQLDLKGKSTYDGFIWAIVHKDCMRALRDERYDLSLTVTKENAKLPDWVTVMSESAELTDLLLTNELVAAIKNCGESFESLILSDMPEDAPKTLNDLQPKKKLILNVKLGGQASTPASTNLLGTFLRIPDLLVSSKLRPEVTRKVKATRDEEVRKIKKLDDQTKAEDRKLNSDKAKKEEREKKLKGLSAEEQRKFLEKEREKDQRKSMGKRSIKA